MLPPEAGYTPLRALADFLRLRDMTCRFPGRIVPATRCALARGEPVVQLLHPPFGQDVLGLA